MTLSRSIYFAASGLIPLFLMAGQYSIVYMFHIFFIHSSVDGHLCYSHAWNLPFRSFLGTQFSGIIYSYCQEPKSPSWAIITSWTFPSSQMDTFGILWYPFKLYWNSVPLSTNLLRPWKPTFYFMSLWIECSRVPYVTETIQYFLMYGLNHLA